MSKLEHLDIHDNKITSELPEFISQISTLQVLNLRNTTLQGSIPNGIFKLSGLQILDLSNNHLVGNISPKFGNFAGMIETSNEFSPLLDIVTISIELHYHIVIWKKSKQSLSTHNLQLYSLLDLSMNKLFGEIPASLGKLKDLKLLNISHNILTGKVPVSLGDLESLESKILVGGQMDTMNDPNFFANNSGLCGMQIQVPCAEELSPTKSPKDESKETLFLWKGVGIGYSFGFFIVVGILYHIGYFVPEPLPNHRSQRIR
nr:mdis1-interacting receptor like kinase 2 [Quercus suber]